MTTPLPTRTEPTPCQGSAVECLLSGLAVVAVVPVALLVLSDPVLAVLVGAITTVVVVTLVGLIRG